MGIQSFDGIAKFIRSHEIFHWIAKRLNHFRIYSCIFFGHTKCAIQAKLRKYGLGGSRYQTIQKLRNQYEGERCFIVCTGPSLTISDINKLKNEYTFSMNSICKLFSQTDWRPSFYCILDPGVYKKLYLDEAFQKMKNALIPDRFIKLFHTLTLKNYSLFPLDHYELHWSRMAKKPLQFSGDAYAIVYDVATVTYALMQIAAYMGFKEIYLLGCDCNYSGVKQHFSDYGIKVESDIAEKNMIAAFTAAKQFADTHQFKIYNATRGGQLEVFERADLDSVLGSGKKENE